MDFELLQKQLKRRLSPSRYEHSLGVSRTAERMARRFGVCPAQARTAGLLHDCARQLPAAALLTMAEAHAIAVGEVEQQEPILLHAPVGAVVAELEYGLRDAEIAEAIRRHTTGGPGMTKLAAILYVADAIEPGRAYPGVERLRELAARDLTAALLAAYNQSLAYILRRDGIIHLDTIRGRNDLLMRR